jgi:prevent-host-death family protein
VSARFVTATEFRAKCLGLLDEVSLNGVSITVTKRGRPVAVLGPAKKKRRKSSMGSWAGKAEIVGDIVNFDTSHLWSALREDPDL